MGILRDILLKLHPLTPIAERLDRMERILEKRLSTVEQRVKFDPKAERRWKAEIKGKIDALLRERHLAEVVADDYPFALLARRFNLMSQNEEDGMTLALMATFGVTNRTFVEIGSGTNGGNSGVFAEDLGWRGLMVEKHPQRAEQVGRRFADPGRVACVCAEATPDNVNGLVAENGLSGEIDLFSLDIDSFDYWVFEALTVCSPRIVILEYNSFFGPEIAVTIPLGAPLEDAPEGYHGASLTALANLAEKKGYRLLACDITGTNAFFVRSDIRPEIPAVTPARAFRRKRDRYDPLGGDSRKTIDIITVAKENNLPLHFL